MERFKAKAPLLIMNFDLGDVARNGCFLVLNVVLDNLELYGIDINVPDKNSNCLLHYSAKRGNAETTLKILTLEASPDVVNARRQTPLHLACIHQHKPIIEILVNNKANMNIRDYLGQTPLFYLTDSPSLTELLIAQGADINISNNIGETLLHLAVNAGEKSLVQYFLEQGLQVDAKTACGKTPLMLAVRKGSIEIVDLLLGRGADYKIKNHKNQNLIHLAVESHQIEVCTRLLALDINLNQMDVDGVSPLHLAAQRNYCDIIEILAENNATIDQRDYDSYTPLHVAANKKNNGRAIETLLKLHASIDAVTCNGDLPLHIAAGSGNKKAARLLYRKCFLSVKNRCGLTPLMMAEAQDRGSMVGLLKHLEMRDKNSRTSAIPVKIAN